METLNDLERGVLEKILDGNGPALSILRQQLSQCRVRNREFTGAGFYTDLFVPESVPFARVELVQIAFGDVGARLNEKKTEAGFVLFMEYGKLFLLEGYTYGDESWPDVIEKFELYYISEKRDLSVFS